MKFEKTMNRNFLVTPPQLNQAFESDGKASGFSNGITRRSFLKRTGAASVATLVALNLVTQQKASAAGDNSNGSETTNGSANTHGCNLRCDGYPNALNIKYKHRSTPTAPWSYFTTVECKCVNGHPMGTFRDHTLTYSEFDHYVTWTGNLPDWHTLNHTKKH